MTELATTRIELQRVATHVLARARHSATGRFGLRATPGGIGTPAFGPAGEVLRIAGTVLVREQEGEATFLELAGASLASAAAFAGQDLALPFSAGSDSPALGDPGAPLAIDAAASAVLQGWWAFGWQVLDAVSAGAGGAAAVQLWPEHFDAGTVVAVGPGERDRCNLGASPGDGFCDEPYLYAGPWGDRRPGGPALWNAPFGAVLRRSELGADPAAEAVDFLVRRLDLLRGLA
jgi:hypothetical protein